MKRPFLTFATGLLGAALLSGCQSTPGGSTPPPVNGNRQAATTLSATQTLSGNITVSVPRAITPGIGKGELRVAGMSTRSARIDVAQLPAGLSLTPSALVLLSSGEISLPFTYTGTASSGDVAVLNVTADGKTSRVEVPVMNFGTLPIAAPGLSSQYHAASLRFTSDGKALLSSTLSGNATERLNLVQFDPASASFSLLPFGITQSAEAITSHTQTPDGKLWVTVRGMTARGSYLVSRDQGGAPQVYWADAAGDTLNNLGYTPDGKLWFTQNSKDSIKSLTPATAAVSSYPVTEQADSLVVAPSGKLYYAAFYARPAIVELDPASGHTRSFDVGEANRSLPVGLKVAPDGSVWFVEARTGTVWKLDPASGTQTQFPLPSQARPSEITFGAGGQVWVSDPTNGVLYTTFTTTGGNKTVYGLSAVAQASGAPDGPSALNTAPDGKIWYVAAGQVVRQQ